MKISYFDTTICNENLGNAIITESILDVFDECFPDAFLIKLPYREGIERNALEHIIDSDLVFFAGTNSLSSQMREYSQWGITERNRRCIRDVILCGLGWWQYQDAPDAWTTKLLHDVLSHRFMHSARDAYTMKKLNEIGISNVINTGCPTMWKLTPEHCAQISRTKAASVVLALTDYNKQPRQDRELIRSCQVLYKHIFFWVQGPKDLEYGHSLCPKMEFLPPRLKALDDLLSSDEDIEYVGTRLHAGIRAMQHKRRATIIGIDNRAIEISRDTLLPVIARGDRAGLFQRLERELAPSEMTVRMPWDAIEAWKAQFRHIQARSSSETPRAAAASSAATAARQGGAS